MFFLYMYMRRPKIREHLYFIFFILPKHIKDMESKSILGVTSMCSNHCTTPVGHTEDDTSYICSQNLLPFLLKCNTKFLEKFKCFLILGSA